MYSSKTHQPFRQNLVIGPGCHLAPFSCAKVVTAYMLYKHQENSLENSIQQNYSKTSQSSLYHSIDSPYSVSSTKASQPLSTMPKASTSHLHPFATTKLFSRGQTGQAMSNRVLPSRVRPFPLFKNRVFQYGPSLAISEPGQSRTLVYYPLGSGKTLASLHAAASFLSQYPSGEILVVTTKANVETTWRENIELYIKTWSQCDDFNPDHADVLNGLDTVVNIDWWFSAQNNPVAHYNRLIRLLTVAGETRANCICLTVDELVQRAVLHLRRLAPRGVGYLKLKKELRRFRKRQCKTLRRALRQQGVRSTKEQTLGQLRRECVKHQVVTNQTMLEQVAPHCPYLLIVDECQEYLQPSAQTTMVLQLAHCATRSLMLSATPIHAVENTRGLQRLLGGARNWEQKILHTDCVQMNVRVQEHTRPVSMTVQEWKTHQKSKARWCGQVQNAYLCKSRQLCNNNSKWHAMATQIRREQAQGSRMNRIVVYSYFLARGVEGFQQFLRTHYRDLSCSVLGENQQVLKWFNSSDVDTRVLLLSSRSGKGISLKNVSSFHLMEPQWSAADEEQAIGRATRTGSHARPGSVVRVYRWVCTSPTHLKSTDQHMQTTREVKRLGTLALLRQWREMGRQRLEELLLQK